MNGSKRKSMYLAFRNGVNKLTGKQSLIDEYNDAVAALAQKSDSMQKGPQKENLLKQLTKIEEEQWEIKDGIASAIHSFNPYLIKTSKAKIKSKIALLNELKKQYNVK